MPQSSELWNKLIPVNGSALNGSLGQSPQQRQEDDCNAEKGQVCQFGRWHGSEWYFSFFEGHISTELVGAEATHSVAGSCADFPLALCHWSLPGSLSVSKLMGE